MLRDMLQKKLVKWTYDSLTTIWSCNWWGNRKIGLISLRHHETCAENVLTLVTKQEFQEAEFALRKQITFFNDGQSGTKLVETFFQQSTLAKRHFYCFQTSPGYPFPPPPQSMSYRCSQDSLAIEVTQTLSRGWGGEGIFAPCLKCTLMRFLTSYYRAVVLYGCESLSEQILKVVVVPVAYIHSPFHILL